LTLIFNTMDHILFQLRPEPLVPVFHLLLECDATSSHMKVGNWNWKLCPAPLVPVFASKLGDDPHIRGGMECWYQLLGTQFTSLCAVVSHPSSANTPHSGEDGILAPAARVALCNLQPSYSSSLYPTYSTDLTCLVLPTPPTCLVLPHPTNLTCLVFFFYPTPPT
jgi:hypothetical protein